MPDLIKLFTVEDFEALVALPENRDKRLIFVDEMVIDVTSNQKSSSYAAWILIALGKHIEEEDLGDVTGADGGYIVAGARLSPDVGFISRKRQPEPPDVTYNPLAPDFAVEVISPSDLEKPAERIEPRLKKYLEAKIPLLWLVYPHRKQIEVYAYGEHIRTAGIGDILDGADVIIDWQLPVKQIFRH